MTARMDVELLKKIRAAEGNPQLEIPVIVTLSQGANLKALEEGGLKIQRIFQSISAVSGTLLPGRVEELAQLDQVEAIELDGPVQAL